MPITSALCAPPSHSSSLDPASLDASYSCCHSIKRNAHWVFEWKAFSPALGEPRREGQGRLGPLDQTRGPGGRPERGGGAGRRQGASKVEGGGSPCRREEGSWQPRFLWRGRKPDGRGETTREHRKVEAGGGGVVVGVGSQRRPRRKPEPGALGGGAGGRLKERKSGKAGLRVEDALSPRTRSLVSANHSGVCHKVGGPRDWASVAASLAEPFICLGIGVLCKKNPVGWAGAPRSSHSLTRLPITNTLVNWLKYRAWAPAGSLRGSHHPTLPTPRTLPLQNHSSGPFQH